MNIPFTPLRFILLSLASFLLASPAKAGNPTVHLSAAPAWLGKLKPYNQRPSLRSVQNGYYLALYERQINIEVEGDYRHMIREIISDAGIQNGSQISVSFDPTFERVDFHQITVWRDNKPLNRLDAAAFKVVADEQELSKFIYQGSYTAVYILKDIRKGDRIEYAYTVTGRNPIFDGKFCKDIYLQGSQLFAHEYVSLLFSKQRSLHFKSFNNVPAPVITDSGTLQRYEWESFQVPQVNDADNQPSWYNTYSHVQISEFNSWAQVVNWELKVNPAATNIKGTLNEAVLKMKKEAGNNQYLYFRKAVETVQDEIRYMGVELGEYSHRANRPERVFDQRYGDCKDKSLLLVSLLKAGGIEAAMAVLNTNEGSHIDQYLPAPNIFDHAIVVAVLNGKQVWIDPTIAYQRGEGANIYHPDYQKALMVKEGNDKLSDIPPLKTGESKYEEVFTVKDGTAPVKMDVITTYTLNEADRMRDKLASTGMAQTEKSYLDYYSKIYPKIEAHDSVTVLDNEQKNQLQTIEHYQIRNFFKKNKETDQLDCDFYANFVSELLPEVGSRTHTPVAVDFPKRVDYTIKLILPGGYDITNTDTAINRDAYRFFSAFSTHGDTLFLRYQFAYLNGFIPVNKLDEFRQDIADLKDHQLGYRVAYTPRAPVVARAPVNTGVALYAICLFIALTALCIWIYHRETPGIVFSYGSTFVPLGGWLILIVIGLVLTSIAMLIFLSASDYFNLDTWNAFPAGEANIVYKTTLLAETTGNIIILCYSAFCLVLILNRRDIFPGYMTGFLLFNICFFVVDYLLLHKSGGSVKKDQAMESIVRSVIFAFVWFLFFKRSAMVEDTFIVPHPANNYSYEGPARA